MNSKRSSVPTHRQSPQRASGMRVRDIASATGQGASTIRSHVNRIFRRHSISRQADPVRLVLYSSGQVQACAAAAQASFAGTAGKTFGILAPRQLCAFGSAVPFDHLTTCGSFGLRATPPATLLDQGQIRLVHARGRRNLRAWDGWNEAADGVPTRGARVALAISMFPFDVWSFGERLGVRPRSHGRDRFMNVCPCVAHVLRAPEAMLFRDYAGSPRVVPTGAGFRAEARYESIAMANTLVNGIPMLGGLTELEPPQAHALKLYFIFRARWSARNWRASSAFLGGIRSGSCRRSGGAAGLRAFLNRSRHDRVGYRLCP